MEEKGTQGGTSGGRRRVQTGRDKWREKATDTDKWKRITAGAVHELASSLVNGSNKEDNYCQHRTTYFNVYMTNRVRSAFSSGDI